MGGPPLVGVCCRGLLKGRSVEIAVETSGVFDGVGCRGADLCCDDRAVEPRLDLLKAVLKGTARVGRGQACGEGGLRADAAVGIGSMLNGWEGMAESRLRC